MDVEIIVNLVKIKALSMLNGGGPGSLKHLKVALEIRKKSKDYKFYFNIVTNVLKNHPIILEFFHMEDLYINTSL